MPNHLTWEIEILPLELVYTWRISRNASDRKTNLIVKISDGKAIGLGEVAPNIRYNETPEIIAAAFAGLQAHLPREPISDTELFNYLDKQNVPNALDFGLRSAYQHFLAKTQNKSLPDLLGLEPVGLVPTSFSVPIMPIEALQGFLTEKKVQRFKWLKLKVNPENIADTVRETARLTNLPLLLDGNEAWQNPDDLIRQTKQLTNLGVLLMEQPLPAANATEYEYLKPLSPFPLLADESVTDRADFARLKKQFHGINVKLMKARSYNNGIHLLKQAKENGLFTMLGCMVETTLGISSAMNLAALADYTDLDGFLLLKNDPYKFVEEKNGLLKLA